MNTKDMIKWAAVSEREVLTLADVSNALVHDEKPLYNTQISGIKSPTFLSPTYDMLGSLALVNTLGSFRLSMKWEIERRVQ